TRIGLGDEEKAYAFECPPDRMALVRGRHSERWPFTEHDALALAIGVGEIKREEAHLYVGRELKTSQELWDAGDRLKEIIAKKQTASRKYVIAKNTVTGEQETIWSNQRPQEEKEKIPENREQK
ncbi:MAG: hypothetical protein ACREGR_02655, partial [Minisyncoccia bacterium]